MALQNGDLGPPNTRPLAGCALTWGQVLALIAEYELTAERARVKERDAGLVEIERYWQAVADSWRLAAQSLRNAALVADGVREDAPK